MFAHRVSKPYRALSHCHRSSARMPPRLHCLCPRCKGALVAERTYRKHASEMNVEPPILSFSAWASQQGHHENTTRPRSDDPSGSTNYSTHTSTTIPSGHNDDATPLKRLRTMAVGVR